MTIDLALEKLIPGLQEIYGDLIDSVILYGSTARGTRTADSDVDVAILLRAGATKVMRDQMLDLVVDLELECGKVLSVLCIDYDKFAEWKGVLPFYKNIRKDGVVLWQAAYRSDIIGRAVTPPTTVEVVMLHRATVRSREQIGGYDSTSPQHGPLAINLSCSQI